ncbi:MAG: ABC transporter ATP-binding protein [Terrimicrobiaceae bacterium]
MSAMVSLRGLHKRFGKRPAIEDISLEVPEGEIFGLLGHNGAGKSTTFGIMLGMVAPTRGEAFIAGHSVQTNRSRALAGVGAIFETPSFYEYLSGWENLRFFVSLSGRDVPRAEMEAAVHLVGLADRIGDPVKNYSHGMRQRLGLAQALVPRPRFILLDEPTDGLDPLGIREMRGMIRRLRDEFGITVMLSSHLLSEVEQLCDRVAILHRGKMVFCGKWKETPDLWQFTLEPQERSEEILRAHGLKPLQDSWVAPEGFDPARLVEALVREGIHVRGLQPVRQTLEDFYLETIQR